MPRGGTDMGKNDPPKRRREGTTLSATDRSTRLALVRVLHREADESRQRSVRDTREQRVSWDEV